MFYSFSEYFLIEEFKFPVPTTMSPQKQGKYSPEGMYISVYVCGICVVN